jgi:hypothetical protein
VPALTRDGTTARVGDVTPDCSAGLIHVVMMLEGTRSWDEILYCTDTVCTVQSAAVTKASHACRHLSNGTAASPKERALLHNSLYSSFRNALV